MELVGLGGLSGWHPHLEEHGLVLTSSDGEIEVRERCAPLCSFAALCAERWPDIAILDLGPMQEFVTTEGEYGEMISARDHAGVERTIVAIWGDDWFATIAARCHSTGARPRIRRAIAELAGRVTLGLGRGRRRRFRYTAPPGFVPAHRGLLTRWHDPQDADVTLIVGAACPRASIAPPFEERVILGHGLGPAERGRPFASDSGLAGAVYWWRRVDTITGLAALEDEAFFYHLRVDSPACAEERTRDMFARVLASCVAIPGRGVRRFDTAAFAHWSD